MTTTLPGKKKHGILIWDDLNSQKSVPSIFLKCSGLLTLPTSASLFMERMIFSQSFFERLKRSSRYSFAGQLPSDLTASSTIKTSPTCNSSPFGMKFSLHIYKLLSRKIKPLPQNCHHLLPQCGNSPALTNPGKPGSVFS